MDLLQAPASSPGPKAIPWLASEHCGQTNRKSLPSSWGAVTHQADTCSLSRYWVQISQEQDKAPHHHHGACTPVLEQRADAGEMVPLRWRFSGMLKPWVQSPAMHKLHMPAILIHYRDHRFKVENSIGRPGSEQTITTARLSRLAP